MIPPAFYRIPVILTLASAGLCLAWYWAGPSSAPVYQPTPQSKSEPTAPSIPSVQKWQAPTGDPLTRYQAAKTVQERKEIIGSFMALGHENNAFMLAEALKDEDAAIRLSAVEQASQLTPEQGTVVYAKGATSTDANVREMTWSLVAPHPVENRAMVYSHALEKGDTNALEEVLLEMGRSPEKAFFETALIAASKSGEAARQQRVFRELQIWLVPGGGDVPTFTSVAQLMEWWKANSRNYDPYMLRVDQ